MSKWNHLMCEACWNTRNPHRTPIKVREEYRDESATPCCFCGKPTQSGIYVRHDPQELLCHGIAGEHLHDSQQAN